LNIIKQATISIASEASSVTWLFRKWLQLYLIQDIELSREINDSFRQSAQARTKLPSGIELNVHVLTTGYLLPSVFISCLSM
jgi:hypothetical protein